MLGTVHSRYRRSGATPPYGDPRAYHGGAMEGYFWRFSQPDTGRVVAALIGVNRGPDGLWANVTLAGHPGGFLRSAIVERDVQADPRRLGVRAGSALVATEDHLALDLGPDARLEVDLGDRSGWEGAAFGGLGPAQALPGLSQYWHPHLLGAGVTGTARLGEDTVTLGPDTAAYAEKNWGRGGFPERWWWGQAQAFAREDVCLAFAGGQIDLGPAHPSVTAIVVRVGGEIVRVGAPLGLVRARVDQRGWLLRARTRTLRVDVEGDDAGTTAHPLPVPLPAEHRTVAGAAQHFAGRVRVRVRRLGRVLFEGESALAGLERGER